jgi:hypothetical protein
MVMQASLFGPMTEQNANKMPVHSGTPTSAAAARQIAGHTKTLRAQVFAYFVRRKDLGATDEEVQRALRMPGNTERPRRQELEEQGLVIDSGLKRTTASGREAVVWVLKNYAPKQERN